MSRFYITDVSDNVVLPVEDGSVGAPISVGTFPQAIAITPDRTKAYVANASDGTVSVIDTASDTITATISVGFTPIAAAVTPDGAICYIVNRDDGTVSAIDVATDVVTDTIIVGSSPVAVAFTPDSTLAYVADQGDGDVIPITVPLAATGTPITVGTSPAGVAVTPDGLKAYVTNELDNSVSIIDVLGGSVSGTITSVGNLPSVIAISPDGVKAYVCDTPPSPPGDVTVIDVASDTVTGTVDPTLIGSGIFADSLVFSDDSTEAFAVVDGLGLATIDVGSDVAAAFIAFGTAPFAIALVSESTLVGRVGIAFDDGPHEPDPTWTWLDSDPGFPDQFVSGYDTHSGRQTLLAQTDTGTASVYINDHKFGLFDPRNTDSDYYGKLDGKQIILQLYDPVIEVWEPQWRGWIDFATYDIDGSAVDANGDPINASIQLECVDVFEQLGGYGLTPGLDGVRPPSGMEDGVYYAETAGTVRDRILEILTDALGADWVAAMSIVASGNVSVIAVKYDPDESALVALRDACDAELPFIANMYVNRHGQFVFRGRYSRFYPDEVAAEPGSEWDFTRWAVGDGKAIQADATRAQMRVLSYTRGKQDIINVAICFPQGIEAAKMPNQVFADVDSIDAYGRHNAPPMSDLLTLQGTGTTSTWDKFKLCFRYAKLLVRNKQGPHIAISRLQVKTVHPDDERAPATWAVLTRSDVSHIVNVAVGYPGGTGLTGNSPADDHYIESRSLKVRPLQPGFDYVELDCGVTPFEWSADTHNVFPPFSGDTPIMAEFSYAYEGDPGTIDFTDTSTEGPSGPITAWAWDFGDGGSDTVQNPTYVYAANGTYEVTLTVTGTGGDGTDSDSRLVKITDV